LLLVQLLCHRRIAAAAPALALAAAALWEPGPFSLFVLAMQTYLNLVQL
jgi:hypothetical protein